MQTPQKPEERKPLPRLPRGWSRLCHETSLFLRSIGLGIVPTIVRGFFRKDFSEPRKVAVHQSRVIALFRALIHVIPLAVALMEIILNWKGRYIGDTFDKQSYYQFAAKAHEITLQASLVSIALSYLRFQLTFGKGLPFGAFLSGLQITQVSYLWSTELWSSLFVSSKTFQIKSKLALLAIVIICGIIAATAGPSSAVLLIPRQTRWHSGSTYFYVNGTFQDVWPDHVDAKKIPKDCAVISSSNTVKPVCPAAGWQTLASDIFRFTSQSRMSFEDSNVAHLGSLQDPDASQRTISVHLCTNSAKYQICGSCPQVAVLKGVMDEALAYFESMMNANATFTNLYTNLDKDLFQSYTLSTCVFDTFHETEYQKHLQFARITETGRQDTQNRTILAVPSLPSVMTASGNASEYRLQWVNLPEDDFSNAAIGAVILHPRVPKSQAQDVTACTLGAGWGTSSVDMDSQSGMIFYSAITGVPSYLGTLQSPSEQTVQLNAPDFANISGYAYPQRRIKISEDWAQFLNPTFIKSDGSNTSMIHNYMSASSYPLGEIGTSKIMSAMLTAGLSLVGSDLSWQAIPNTTAPCEGCLVFKVSNSMQGWAYTIDGTFTILAIIVMFVFCVLAFGHIIYLAVSGVSSDAWNSTAEIVALAMNSSPTAYLHNTCAGIIGVNTFKTPVQILVRGDDDQTEHLELVFGDKDQVDAGASRLTMNKDYGKVLTKGYTTSVKVHPAP